MNNQPKNMKIAGVIAGVVLIGVGAAVGPDFVTKQKMKAAVKEHLRDPDSAQFKDLTIARIGSQFLSGCGKVNSRNGFGAMSGYYDFIYQASGDVTIRQQPLTESERSIFCH